MISHKYQMPEKNAGEDWYLLLSVSNNLYAVGLSYVFRITAIDGIQPVPGTKEYILGTIMTDDGVWPVADLRIKFGEKEPGYPRHPKGVLLEYKEYKTCILVDDIQSVFTANIGEMTPVFGKNSDISGSMQIRDRIVSLLSLDSLFD